MPGIIAKSYQAALKAGICINFSSQAHLQSLNVTALGQKGQVCPMRYNAAGQLEPDQLLEALQEEQSAGSL